jgi:hypothetical protein
MVVGLSDLYFEIAMAMNNIAISLMTAITISPFTIHYLPFTIL